MFSPLRRLPAKLSAVALSALSFTGVWSHAGAATPAAPNWFPVAAPSGGPSMRYDASMVFDAATGTTVLFGGSNSGTLAETWTWNGSAWSELSPATSPPPLRGAAMAYDAVTRDVVLFGGLTSSGPVSDTWTWNGTTWTKQSASGPSARWGATLAYDALDHDVVLFGGQGTSGYLSDTWTWSGTSWSSSTVVSTAPPARSEQSMAYDASTREVVLFGGEGATGVLGDTWTWDGANWNPQSAASPPASFGAAMVDDTVSGDLVMFGGSAATSGEAMTWVWNGSYWNSPATLAAPPARRWAAMAYDSVENNVILFGGYDGTSALSDTWSYVVASGAPSEVKATSNVNAESVVTWNAPASDGGSAVLGYSVTSRDATQPGRGGQSCSTTTTTTCTVLALTNGDHYTFEVSAVTGVGIGLSSASNEVTPATAPGAAMITKVLPGNGQLILYWSAPVSNGGTPISTYRVIARPGGAFCHVPGTVTSCRVTGLRNGRDYSFTVSATNAAGTGPNSLASTSIKPRTLPGAPIITSTRVVGRSIIVTWKPPPSNGGLRLGGYEIYVGPVPGGEGTQPLNSRPLRSLSFKFQGRRGFSVYLYLRAASAAGIGARSVEVVATVR